MNVANFRELYFFFFVSGFCSLVYQMVWTRLAFAAFGIITPVLSVVLSVFMLGLAVGAWLGGRTIPWLVRKTGFSAIFFYGAAELVIGLGAFAVPGLFALGQKCLLAAGQTDSFLYLFLSALVLSAAILPWCLCMGATFPWMMAYMREGETRSADSFSYLYFANVLGAMTGTLLTAVVLVEVLGFHHTLALAAAGNFLIAGLSWAMGWEKRGRTGAVFSTPAAEPAPAAPQGGGLAALILFTTGFCAMAMEVVWTRAFAPILKTQVYSFALIVFTYLGATFFGSLLYRSDLRRNRPRELGELIVLLAVAAFLPIIAVDPRFLPASLDLGYGTYRNGGKAIALVLGSICPLCCVLGYLTPRLIDQYASGHPAAAGKAYAINVVGCILGPLCASYLLLPWLSERYALALLGLPLLALVFLCRKTMSSWQFGGGGIVAAGLLVWSLFFANDFEGLLQRHEVHAAVRRDYAASVISFGEGFGRRLLVNGIGMTSLTPETKFMVHVPMALQKEKPKSALIICFGMGTSFRAALSWDARTTAVELVPSVAAAFGFYHEDAANVLADTNGRIVIDDGRRFLKRTREKYDVIVVDPPPPLEAAGSSLLYSREFYELAREHLNPAGILQIWIPGGPALTMQAALRSIYESFPHVRVFPGVEGWGRHLLGSMQPIPEATSAELAARLPSKARADFTEWMDPVRFPTPADYFQKVIGSETPPAPLLNTNQEIEITDDRPFNEYYLVRESTAQAP